MKKNAFTLFMIIMLLIEGSATFAQTVKLYVVNQNVIGTDFYFEIQMEATSGTLYLAAADLALTFNSGNFTNPTTTVSAYNSSYWTLLNSNGNNTTSSSGNLSQSYRSLVSPAAITSNEIILNVNSPSFSGQDEFDQNVAKITNTIVSFGQYKISGISIAGGTMGLAWKTSGGGVVTNIKTFANTDPWGQSSVTLDVSATINDAPLPVELSTFSATVNLNNVNLNWKTATEVNNNGFEIQREVRSQESEVTSQWEKVGFMQGHGNSNSPKEYSFTDKNLTGGTNFVYRLKQIDNDGQYEYSKEIEVEVVPKDINLLQNYPNPFNPVTEIKFTLPEATRVTLRVYNIIGQEVASLVNGIEEAGYHNVSFDGSKLSSGTYIYRLQTNNFIQTKKMVLLK